MRFSQIQNIDAKTNSSVLAMDQEIGMSSNGTDPEIVPPGKLPVNRITLQLTNFIQSADSHPAELPVWKPQMQENLIMLCLSVVSLVVALDATILVPALPVSAHPHEN